MNRKKLTGTALGLLAAVVLLAGPVRAQDHPGEHAGEHPTEGKKEAEPRLTVAELSQAIRDYVANDAKLKGGTFLLYDPVGKKVLQLSLAKVHEDKLASLGNDVYFACADFESADKHLYDLDVFMKQTDTGLETTGIAVHKVDGTPRYTWYEEGGIWKKKETSGR